MFRTHHSRLCRLIAISLVTLLSSEAWAARKIVFLAGGRSHGPGEHEFNAGCLLLAKALNESNLDIEATVIQGWPKDESVLDGIKGLVIYADGTSVVGKGWEKVDQLAKSGVGLMFMHYAVHPTPEEGEKYYRPWIGGAFETGYSVNPHWVADLKALPNHPVSQGVGSLVEAFDEFYYNMRFIPERGKVLDLVTATPDRQRMKAYINLWNEHGVAGLDKPQTLMWGIERRDGGRGVGFTGGHYHRNWSIDNFRKIVLNAIVWTAGLEVPKEGVPSKALTEDELNANLDDKGKVIRLKLVEPGEFKAKPAAPIQTERESKFPKTSQAAPQKSNEETLVPLDRFNLPDEKLEVTVWATTPMLNNPTNIDFDKDGRLYVAEGVNYRRQAVRPEGDRIVILEDSDGNGSADLTSVFTQDKNLESPLGIAVLDHQIVVSQPPDLIVYTDVNGDRKFDPATDKKKVLLTGFNARQHDHSLHSVTAGPDGQWNFNNGNCGGIFTDQSGKTFRIGSSYYQSGGGTWYSDTRAIAGQPSDDGNVWVGGFSVRMNPDGTNARIVGHNYRNSYEQAMTSFGDLFQSDNDDPPACRVAEVIEGGNAGFSSADGQRSWRADKRPGQSTPIAEWRQEDPGTMPSGDVYGGGSPTGVAYYENGALGDQWQGLLLACEAGKNVVFGYLPVPDGAGFTLKRIDFLDSNPQKKFAGSDFIGGANNELHTRFRPSDVAVGPDGALYVADWFDPRVGGHGTSDKTLSGTIYRIAPKGFKSVVPKIDLSTIEGQITALKSPAVNVRNSGFTRLKAQGAKALPAVRELLNDKNPHIAARAVWLLAQMGDEGQKIVIDLLKASEPRQRLVATRALRAAGYDVLKLAEMMVDDTAPMVRREIALSLRDVSAEKSVPFLAKIAAQFDGKDRAYLEALGLGSTRKEAAVYDAARALMKQTSGDKWSDAFAWIAWRLHPDQAVADLKVRALASSSSAEQKMLMVTAIAFNESPAASAAMVDLAKAGDFAHKDLAFWWINNRKGNLWKAHNIAEALTAMGKNPDTAKLTPVQLPPVPANAPKLPPTADIVKLVGDKERGKAALASCYMCHKVGDQGIDYGPDLTTFGRQQPSDVIIKAIAEPGADVSHGFEGTEIKTKDGITIVGIALSEGDPVIIKCFGGQTQTIAKSRIASMKKMKQSLMYDPANLGLTAQSIADIAAYLKSL